MNKYQHEEGKGCLGKTLGILAIAGITLFSIGSAFANPVDDFVNTQKNFILGMQNGSKTVVEQLTPVDSEISNYVKEQRTIANNEADVNSAAYSKGSFTGMVIPYITAVAVVVTQ